MRFPTSVNGIATAVFLSGFLAAAAPNGEAAAADKRVSLKMASAYPSKLVQLGSLGVNLSKKVELISGGSIRLMFYEPHSLLPPFEMFDAVSSGSLDAAWSNPGFWVSKDEAFALFSAVPFGPPAGEYAAWMFHGGGKELMAELYAQHSIVSLTCGVVAPEASGWFRREITSIEDLRGLRMRFFGMGAKVMERVGVSTQLIAGRDIFHALEHDTIDAAEYSMPAMDLNLGFYQVAKHYYFPGWHQQSTLFNLMISRKKWRELSKVQKAQLEVACGDNFREGLANGEAIQGKALAELKAKGVMIHRWPQEILDELNRAWLEVAAELSEANPNFKKIWASLQAFRAEHAAWRALGYL